MADTAETVAASTPATDETTSTDNATEDKTTAASASESASASTANETPAAAESASEKGKETKEDGSASTSTSAGEKRKADDDEIAKTGAKTDTTSSTTTDTSTTPAAPAETAKPKKAKIAMPPSVSSSLMDVEKYKLEAPPPEDNTNEADVTKKITTANLMLFGLHPLIREDPLKKMLEDYGTVQAITVRSAFASRYGHVSFDTVEEARKCYVAIHGAKLLHKAFLVQPSMASAVVQEKSKAPPAPASAGAAAASATASQAAASVTASVSAPSDSAGAAAAAAAAVTTTSSS